MGEHERGGPGVGALLRNRNFRSYWMGSTLSTAGVYVGTVLFDWIISASAPARDAAILLAVLGILEFVPSFTVGILAGAWADRHDRRRLMLVCQIGRLLAFAGLAAFVLRAGFDPVVVLGAALAISALGSVFGPASNAILPQLIQPTELAPANGLVQSGGTVVGFLCGPAGGALVLLFGLGVGFATDSLLYGLSAAAIACMVVPIGRAIRSESPPPDLERPTTWEDVREGLTYLRSQRPLLALVLVGTVLNFFSYYNIYIVLYARYSLHSGPGVFGLLLGAAAAGAAAGALLTHRLGTDRAPGVWVPLLWGLSGVPLVVLIVVPTVPVALLSLAAQGFLASVVNVTLVSSVQRTVPARYLGRFFATDSALSYAMIPAGLAVGAVVVVDWGIGPAFLLAGAGMVAVGLAALARRDVRSWGRIPAPGRGAAPSP